MPLRLCRGEPGTEFCQSRRSDRSALPGRPSRRCDQHQHRTAEHDRGLSFGRFLVSVGSPIKQVSVNGAAARLNWLRANLAWSFALFTRARKSAVTAVWRAPARTPDPPPPGRAILARADVAFAAPAGSPAPPAPHAPH